MISMQSVRAVRPLQRMLVTLLVILGTAVSLLLAHSLERVYPAELTHSAPVAPISDAAAVEVDREDRGHAASTLHDTEAPRAYLGFACCFALLFALIRMSKAPVTIWLGPSVRRSRRTRQPEAPPRSVTLVALCISRT